MYVCGACGCVSVRVRVRELRFLGVFRVSEWQNPHMRLSVESNQYMYIKKERKE